MDAGFSAAEIGGADLGACVVECSCSMNLLIEILQEEQSVDVVKQLTNAWVCTVY